MWQFRPIARRLAALTTRIPIVSHRHRLYSVKPRPRPRKPLEPTSDPTGSQSAAIDLRTAFRTEIETLNAYAALLNQTSARSVRDLVDISPLMALYTTFPPSLANAAALRVINALKQTAKDAAYFSRSFPQHEQRRFQYAVGSALVTHVDFMAQRVVDGTITDKAAIYALFRTYEHVDPRRGVLLYAEMPRAEAWGGAVIPLLVKTEAPLAEIRRAFEREAESSGGLARVNPRSAASMVLALVKYGESAAGEALFSALTESDAADAATQQFLIDVFIGDAPTDLAQQFFFKFPGHVPHHSAMARFLAALNAGWPEQLAVFGEYLRRLSVPRELSIKPVAQQMVANLFTLFKTEEEVVSPIVDLCEVYARYVSEHELLLNLIVTGVSQRFTGPNARPLLLNLFSNYAPTASAVSYRVRLNALEHLPDPELVAELWEARQARGELQKWDWFALLRADRGGAYFQAQWDAHGQPFAGDVTRFRRSRSQSMN